MQRRGLLIGSIVGILDIVYFIVIHSILLFNTFPSYSYSIDDLNIWFIILFSALILLGILIFVLTIISLVAWNNDEKFKRNKKAIFSCILLYLIPLIEGIVFCFIEADGFIVALPLLLLTPIVMVIMYLGYKRPPIFVNDEENCEENNLENDLDLLLKLKQDKKINEKEYEILKIKAIMKDMDL